jgi:hypothetical protein
VYHVLPPTSSPFAPSGSHNTRILIAQSQENIHHRCVAIIAPSVVLMPPTSSQPRPSIDVRPRHPTPRPSIGAILPSTLPMIASHNCRAPIPLPSTSVAHPECHRYGQHGPPPLGQHRPLPTLPRVHGPPPPGYHVPSPTPPHGHGPPPPGQHVPSRPAHGHEPPASSQHV